MFVSPSPIPSVIRIPSVRPGREIPTPPLWFEKWDEPSLEIGIPITYVIRREISQYCPKGHPLSIVVHLVWFISNDFFD